MACPSLNGRHALVTGGGTGIGLAVAASLAAHGATVTITGRRPEPLDAAAQTHGFLALTMDVTNENSVSQGFEKASQIHGPITICVANAGIAEGGNLAKTPLADWRRTMATNLDGAFLSFRAALPGMMAADWGRLIAVSSIAGLRGLKGATAYTASKHGMIGLIKGLAADLARTGITANALCPAYVDTAIVADSAGVIARRTGKSVDEARQSMISINPHGRLIAPEEVAAAAIWLCDPGSGSVNGQAIEIAGGEL